MLSLMKLTVKPLQLIPPTDPILVVAHDHVAKPCSQGTREGCQSRFKDLEVKAKSNRDALASPSTQLFLVILQPLRYRTGTKRCLPLFLVISSCSRFPHTPPKHEPFCESWWIGDSRFRGEGAEDTDSSLAGRRHGTRFSKWCRKQTVRTLKNGKEEENVCFRQLYFENGHQMAISQTLSRLQW